MAASWGAYGLSRTNILNRPVRTTARTTLVLRDRFRDGSARLDGPQTAPSSPNRGLTKSAHGRVADQGGKGSDGHHVGLDRTLPSHHVADLDRRQEVTFSWKGYGHPDGHLLSIHGTAVGSVLLHVGSELTGSLNGAEIVATEARRPRPPRSVPTPPRASPACPASTRPGPGPHPGRPPR